MLLQKLPAETFTATAKLSFTARTEDERFAFVVMGINYAYLSVVKRNGQLWLTYNTCVNADKNAPEEEKLITTVDAKELYFKLALSKGAKCTFGYSTDGKVFTDIPGNFAAVPGKWIGAKIGFFCSRTAKTNDGGYADIDWFRIER
jgi:hypothetical protein